MAGLTTDTPTPSSLTAHGKARVLEIAFSDGAAATTLYVKTSGTMNTGWTAK